MNVLVTGAAGFVGSHLVRHILSAGCRVSALIRKGSSIRRIRDIESRIETIEGDFCGPEMEKIVRAVRPEVCVHLAWTTTPGSYLTSPENAVLADGTIRLARTLAESGCRKLAAAGTCFEYDVMTPGVLTEQSRLAPHTPYASAKLKVFKELEKFSEGAAMNFVWTRLFYLYGPWENERRLVPRLIQSFTKNEPIRLAAQEKIRDYLHVDDVAAAVWTCAQGDLTGAVNIASGEPITLREMADRIGRLMGQVREEYDMLPDDPMDPPAVQGDNLRLKSAGWNPRYTLDAGLRNVIDWWAGQ